MKTLRNALVVAAASCLMAAVASATTCPGPDAGGYSCTTNPSGFGLLTTTSANLLSCDDCSVIRNIGFTFNHYGTPCTTVRIVSNAFIDVGGGGTSLFAGFCTYPIAAGVQGYLGRYDDKYLPGGGSLTDGVSGVTPNRVYTVYWNNVPNYPGGSGFSTFQIQLFENGGAGSMARIVTTVLGANIGDVGQQNIPQTQGLDFDPCFGSVTVPHCVQFAKPTSTGTSTCDLTPIEAKLDDGTRFTSDVENNNQTNTIINTLNPNIARLETKLDDGTRFTSDTERTNLQNAIVTEINQNESKIDRLESKLDDERRFTDDGELAVVSQAIAALEVKADDAGTDLTTILDRNIEHALGEDHNVNKPLALYMLPNAFGGQLEDVAALIDERINQLTAAGCNTGSARAQWTTGNNEAAAGHYDTAYASYAGAYRTLVMGPCN